MQLTDIIWWHFSALSVADQCDPREDRGETMSAKRGKKKEEKPPPATGPGSKIIALPEPLRKKFIKRLPDGKKVLGSALSASPRPSFHFPFYSPSPQTSSRRFGVAQMNENKLENTLICFRSSTVCTWVGLDKLKGTLSFLFSTERLWLVPKSSFFFLWDDTEKHKDHYHDGKEWISLTV